MIVSAELFLFDTIDLGAELVDSRVRGGTIGAEFGVKGVFEYPVADLLVLGGEASMDKGKRDHIVDGMTVSHYF